LRRLIEESYGSLSNFPIVSFLVVDTDKDYKISNPEAAGSAFKDNEKHWSRVSGKQVQEMVSDMDRYPWINSWFPPELERNITSLERERDKFAPVAVLLYFVIIMRSKENF